MPPDCALWMSWIIPVIWKQKDNSRLFLNGHDFWEELAKSSVPKTVHLDGENCNIMTYSHGAREVFLIPVWNREFFLGRCRRQKCYSIKVTAQSSEMWGCWNENGAHYTSSSPFPRFARAICQLEYRTEVAIIIILRKNERRVMIFVVPEKLFSAR